MCEEELTRYPKIQKERDVAVLGYMKKISVYLTGHST